MRLLSNTLRAWVWETIVWNRFECGSVQPQCRTPRKHGIGLPWHYGLPESLVRSAQPDYGYRITRVHHPLVSCACARVYVSMQRGNTWVAKRSISYNMYSYILRRHTRHPVELLRGEQCATVDKDVLTLASGRNILIVLVLLAPFSAGDC